MDVKPALCVSRCSEDALLTLTAATDKNRVDGFSCHDDMRFNQGVHRKVPSTKRCK